MDPIVVRYARRRFSSVTYRFGPVRLVVSLAVNERYGEVYFIRKTGRKRNTLTSNILVNVTKKLIFLLCRLNSKRFIGIKFSQTSIN